MDMHILPTIEEWSASKDNFRVVAYGFSRPFPLEPQIIENEPLIDYHEANIAPRLSEILARNGISFSSIGMLRMVERDKPRTNFVYELEFVDHDDLSTLLITTTSEDTSNWKIAAEEIFSIYADGGFSKDQIEVEIRNPERMAWYTSDILDDDIDILAACQSVKSVLLDQIRAHCGLAWSSVAFHLRTQVCCYNDGPRKPTVLVYCHKGSRCDFDALESALLKIISKVNAGLCLELLPGSVFSANSPLSKPNTLSILNEQPFNGASIGLKGDTERSGTLGGWFMLNLPGSLPSKVVLTSHNIFSGIGDGSSQQTDLVGVTNKEGSEIEGLQVKYPAPADTMATIKHLEPLCLKPGYPSSTHQNLKDFRGATTAPPIGHIIAASGHRLNENCHRMDWALIQVTSFITENRPPPATHLNDRGYPKSGPFMYLFTRDSIITNLCEIIPGSWAVKNGKSTGVTSGYINRMPRTIQWDDQQESEEVDFVGLIHNFVQTGDSGSFVVDESGNLVGLLIAIDLVTSCAFVTPIREILADVKAMTGGNLTIA